MGRIRVGPQAIREYLGRMRERYEQADHAAKGRLLDEVREMTGYHRKAVIPAPSPRRIAATAARRPAGLDEALLQAVCGEVSEKYRRLPSSPAESTPGPSRG